MLPALFLSYERSHYAFAFLSSTPMRETTDRSEMVNVVLFGEAFEILERQPKWIKIRLQHDGYEGWIDPQMCPLYRKKNTSVFVLHASISTVPQLVKSRTKTAVFSRWQKAPVSQDWRGMRLKLDPVHFILTDRYKTVLKIEVPLSRQHYRTQAHPTCGAAEPPSASIVVDLPDGVPDERYIPSEDAS